MKIAFLTTSLGVFGSIRELIENANRLVDYGHEVEIYSDLQKYPFSNWLPCRAKLKQLGEKINKVDVLVLMDSPFDYHFEIFKNTDAKFKTMIMMGFAPDFNFQLGNELYNYLGTNTEKNLFEILKNYEICADSNWQLKHFQKLGIKTGVAIGGINLDMFVNRNGERPISLGWSGDKRPRKASHVVFQSLEKLPLNSDFYFGKGDQKYLVDFLNSCDLFLDNHIRAGWVNPVLEAMACGAVPICRKLAALEEFAINDYTAIVLENPKVEDFVEAVKSIITDERKKQKLRENAKQHVQQFSYDIITKKFETYLKSKI
jgi:glycosyltransferase involved in cell wall biosynthesis